MNPNPIQTNISQQINDCLSIPSISKNIHENSSLSLTKVQNYNLFPKPINKNLMYISKKCFLENIVSSVKLPGTKLK